MENIYRNIYCGEVTKKNIDQTVRLAGFVASIRNLGSLVFIVLRDETGIIQLISNDKSLINNITKESTITVTGIVKARTEDMVNKNMKTGEVEVEINTITLLGPCINTLPFEINKSKESLEDTRLKYRYLDLRNKEVHDNIVFRSRVIDHIRSTMKNMNFLEVQTPIITSSSPEGARDFIIPSRKFKGKFYALPQAPQIFKQLLMVGGFDKYFQIAPCFRDEDPRSDRLYGEFYQLDFEMSFATAEDVYKVGEEVFYSTFTKFGKKEVSTPPFRRIAYNDAMLLYGTDKPDLRNPLIITDITKVFENTTFTPFKDTVVRAIKVKNIDKSNSWYKSMEEYVKSLGGSGLAYIKVNDDMTFKSSLDKFLSNEVKTNLIDILSLEPKNVVFIIADNKNCAKLMGNLRIKLGKELNLINENKYEFCIINDFPFYEEAIDGSIEFSHNPFSMPQGGLEALNTKDPFSIKAYQYDFVCNGYEMASGGVRNHSPEILKRAFEIAGYSEEVVKSKFPSLYEAFKYGAPPHAGMAPGIDRILMLLKDEENIREMVAFPLGANGMDTMMGCPNEVFEKQLQEAHIKIRD